MHMIEGWIFRLAMCLISFPLLAEAQTVEESRSEARAESLVGQEGADDRGETDNLVSPVRSRSRLNTMGRDMLISDLDLTPAQADALLDYRTRFGAFIDPMELQAVPGWSLDLVRRVLPLVRLDTMVQLVPAMRERLEGGRQQIVIRVGSVVERSRGYIADSNGRRSFAGDPLHATILYRFRYRSSLDAGIRLEKDAGEAWLTKNHVPDRVSAFLSLRDLGPMSTLVIGDYEVGLGQGLLIWQGMAFRKGANSMEVMRGGPVFKPHSGSDENRYMRGVAMGLYKGKWTGDLFLGFTKRDAHPVLDTAGGIAYFSSLQTSGLHRTVAEIQGRHALSDLGYGGRLAYVSRGLWVGVNLAGHRFSHELVGSAEPYALHAIKGDRFFNASLDHHLRVGALHMYGEWAMDRAGGIAFTEGMLISPGPRVDLVMQARSFSPGYVSIQESPFAEGSRAQNETGVYLGLEWRPASTFRLSAYVDRYRFPWLKYGVDAPSEGMDAMVRLAWRPARTTEWYGQVSWESRPQDMPGMDPFLPGPVQQDRFRLRLHLEHVQDRFITLRVRGEYCGFRANGVRREQGFLGFGDLIWKNYRQLTRIMFRLLYISTDGYGSRIYAYESAIPGLYSIPPHSGEGVQWSFQVVRRLFKRLELGLGIRQKITQNVESQGSGYDMIPGARKTEWNLHFRSSF